MVWLDIQVNNKFLDPISIQLEFTKLDILAMVIPIQLIVGLSIMAPIKLPILPNPKALKLLTQL